MTSKYKSEGNLFLTYKKAPDTDDLYDPSLIGVTYNEKKSEISLYALTSETVIKCQRTYYSWNVTNHMRSTISGPDLRYQAPTYDIRPRPTISGPKTKQRFRSCSKRFSPRTASKIHEHFDQQNGTKFFLPQLCFIPFSICQVSSKIVKQRRST